MTKNKKFDQENNQSIFQTKPSFLSHPIIFLTQKKIQLSKFSQR